MGTKLVKSNRDKKIMGVCGGIAEYLHVDSTIVRIIWAIAACCFGSGILLYFIAGIIMPEAGFNGNYNNYYNNYNGNYNNGYNNGYNNDYNTNYTSTNNNNTSNNTGYYIDGTYRVVDNNNPNQR